jgi:hypothetical protein
LPRYATAVLSEPVRTLVRGEPQVSTVPRRRGFSFVRGGIGLSLPSSSLLPTLRSASSVAMALSTVGSSSFPIEGSGCMACQTARYPSSSMSAWGAAKDCGLAVASIIRQSITSTMHSQRCRYSAREAADAAVSVRIRMLPQVVQRHEDRFLAAAVGIHDVDGRDGGRTRRVRTDFRRAGPRSVVAACRRDACDDRTWQVPR